MGMANNADPKPENPWINPAMRKISDMANSVIMVSSLLTGEQGERAAE
jgi:hypothetical protein